MEVARNEGDFAYVTRGIEDGTQVVTTRLIDPLENTLLQVTLSKAGGSDS